MWALLRGQNERNTSVFAPHFEASTDRWHPDNPGNATLGEEAKQMTPEDANVAANGAGGTIIDWAVLVCGVVFLLVAVVSTLLPF